MQYEVERKFRVADVEDMLARIQAIGAVSQGVFLQEDTYFRHPCRDFAATDEALRLRTESGRSVLTYKGAKVDDASKTRPEIEVALAPADDRPDAAPVDRMTALLLALDFQPVMQIRKRRERYRLRHSSLDFALDLDEVEGLGLFLEAETVAPAEQLHTALEALAQLVAQLGLSQEERRSYLELLLPSQGPP